MREFVVGGLLIAPFVKYALLAIVVFLPLRFALIGTGLHRWLWHPLLAEASIYLCLVAVLNIFM